MLRIAAALSCYRWCVVMHYVWSQRALGWSYLDDDGSSLLLNWVLLHKRYKLTDVGQARSFTLQRAEEGCFNVLILFGDWFLRSSACVGARSIGSGQNLEMWADARSHEKGL